MGTVNNFYSEINSIKPNSKYWNRMNTLYDTSDARRISINDAAQVNVKNALPEAMAAPFASSPAERESVKVLRECIELQNAKGSDYQSKASSVRQADYYVNGIQTIHDIMHAKMLRMKSVMDKIQAGESTNFESLEDSAKDLINYASFFVAYSRGKIDGQNPDKNIFNK
ncbi:hypothetical protein PS2_044 [Serratia phage PS2]|uniref:Nucleotide modification associated domain-containing protein n=1 Tax=Serratia phage PS2 TaxID=1481112 RepID=A0A023W4P0_9CAUD|nr:hypothetical protein FF83_gp044 [Serratia phage PS2]AHY25294.1 hypothetical protein PS2_044 [Serratia phage PS2]